MTRMIEILTHTGIKKDYYSVHYLIDNEYVRIYGKFSSLKEARIAARRAAKIHKVKDIVVN